MYIKTIMVDLDGVLNKYEKYTEEIPEIREGAVEFLEKLCQNSDCELVLFTTRNNLQASKWLIENKIDKYFKDVTSVKRPAYIYLDDRSVKFEGNYNKALEEISEFKTYWKN